MSTTPDPRPTVREVAGKWVVAGRRCIACRYPTIASPRCPLCGAALDEALFGPVGSVWASTVVRVPVPGRTPPYTLAYVDLDQGPRVLAHVCGAVTRVAVGVAVRVVGLSDSGDLAVDVIR